MKKLLSLLLALILLAGLIPTAAAAELPFSDVKPGSTYYDGVKYVWEKGLMNGTAADRFSPNAGLTRAMLVTILWRMEGSPKTVATDFTDVPENAWYANGVAWAASNGVVTGVGDGKFAPNGALTREQLVTVLYRYSKAPASGDLSGIPDAGKVSPWAQDAMRWAVKYGLLSPGSDGRLAPRAAADRGLVAAVLLQFGSGEALLPPGLRVTDAHEEAANADFSALERIYAGTKATYTALHEHSDSGKVMRDGKEYGSDGKYTLKQWKEELMPELGLDVAAILDHAQVQHLYSPDWDSDRFICGTETRTRFRDLSPEATGGYMHYAMLFDDRDDLMNVLQHFKAFQFAGDSPDPIYWAYIPPRFTKAEFQELVDYVRSVGGIVAFSHPRSQPRDGRDSLTSTNIDDYFLGEYTYFDTLGSRGPYHSSCAENYALWQRLLQAGHHIYASAIGDTHATKRCVPSTVYTTTKKSPEAFAQVKAGNYTAGYMGIKLNISDHAMGSAAGFKPGETLTIEVSDFFTKKADVKPDSDWYLRVFTEKGLAACRKIDVTETTRFALTVQDRAYYRADVFNADNGYAVAIGNPIWKN